MHHTTAVASCLEEGEVNRGGLVAFSGPILSLAERILLAGGEGEANALHASALLGASTAVLGHASACEAMAAAGGGGALVVPSALERLCSAVVANLSSNIRLALDVGRYAASIELLRRAIVWLQSRGAAVGDETAGIDAFAMANVCLRRAWPPMPDASPPVGRVNESHPSR